MGKRTGPTVLNVTAYADDVTRLRVNFSKAVKQVSASNSDDALNPSNYTVTGNDTVMVSAVISITDNVVELTVSGQVPGGNYDLQVRNVEDLANNPIAD